mmetsp:Transcript_7282/g.10735  ORF Transcript_7282/g.10735 Transcript_7282/m.10735 type:complete len:254 (-) Transcript_7282:72-833(-)
MSASSSRVAYLLPLLVLCQHPVEFALAYSSNRSGNKSTTTSTTKSRREAMQDLVSGVLTLGTVAVTTFTLDAISVSAANAEDSSMYNPKFVQEYPDFTQTKSGWSYKDVKPGTSDIQASVGDRCVYEWSGYTIGYFGRPFEAKGGPKGGAFDKDLDYSRAIIGQHTVIPAVEEALADMKVGAVRQVVVPYGSLSYPESDREHDQMGPKPSTFSGQRALNFVLDNPRVDRTLLFNLKLVRVDKANGKGGFNRGT